MNPRIEDLKVKIFADGADLQEMIGMSEKSYISGLTTNPTLMRKAGVLDYRKFARDVLAEIQSKPISFEVFSDDLTEMKNQALEIASWGENVYVKIPISNTLGFSTSDVVYELTTAGVKVNVTAIMTPKQVEEIATSLNPKIPSYISVFAGRIADTGRDPIPTLKRSLEILQSNPSAELIWASPRELLNVIQADQINCHVITATKDILAKLTLLGHNLEEYSLDTVKMFRNDALASAFSI
jgi:transaldolase